MTITLPDLLIETMREIAKQHRRSLNAEIVWALEQYAAELQEHTES